MIHKKRKKNASFGFSGHIQGRFRPFPACFGLFRPYRPPADTTRYGQYSPILAESARFDVNRSRFGTNQAASARIREKKKKKNADAVQRAGNRVPHRTRATASRCSTSGAASMLSRLCLFPLLDILMLVIIYLLQLIYVLTLLLKKTLYGFSSC